jgi:tetratricopeptide (TPR) repeat protein
MASYRHASDIAPAYAEPLGALALLALQGRALDGARACAARACAARALALDPDEAAATLALAKLALQEGRADEAAGRLTDCVQPPLAPPHEALAKRVLGDALDALGRPAEAFAAYAASAAIFRRQFATACAGPHPLAGLDLCHSLRDGFRDAPAPLWAPAPGGTYAEASGGAAGHVFVIGFPRSGTTLLEQVLASHADVVALEEQTTLMPAIDAYLDPPTGIEALAQMDEATAQGWRRDYWERVRGFGVDPAGKVFVDKQPFYTLWLPLIGKLFPKARIVVVRRDPRDVVLSCFRKPFRMTPVTYELMNLDRSARLYAGAMEILELFLERSANPRLIYRHEDLVDDFDGVAGRICDFLGLDWSDRLRDFAATARARDIRTPSAAQVARGLNRDGIAAWRPYAAMLAPVMPILEPLARAYGYLG